MAYTELVKNFQRIRSYMREFYVYGFRTRDEFSGKSGRSYDNERRRLENILGDFTASSRAAGGKNVYLSINSRSGSNPLYRLLKSASFTDRDITLHFILFDILSETQPMSLAEIFERLSACLSGFKEPIMMDESSVRKKLAEYAKQGLVIIEKQGRSVNYRKSETPDLTPLRNTLEFFSEVGICGIIGSYLLDKLENEESVFRFKHHYITSALDSEIMYSLLCAISEKRRTTVNYISGHSQSRSTHEIAPLKIFVSVQNGRQWLMAYSFGAKRMLSYRIDYIEEITVGDVCESFDTLREQLSELQITMWGASIKNVKNSEHIEFTIHIGDNEEYIYNRLLREKRCGKVTRIDEHTAKFTAEVQDGGELVPWIRTFIGRIIQLDFSDRTLENQFRSDIEAMYKLYLGGDDNAV